MKTGIKRIEQTLQRLQQLPDVPVGPIERHSHALTQTSHLSFEIRDRRVASPALRNLGAGLREELNDDPIISSQPLNLPPAKTIPFTPHRNATNPAIASTLLHEMLARVEVWQKELSQITVQIQDLYIEGPLIDGWLESVAPSSSVETIAFRHADITQLLQFVEQLQAGKIAPQQISIQGAAYRICGLNADGQLWYYPCPPDQVPTVSVAIARHHKLRQLRTRQQQLEDRLAQFSENLVRLHSQLKD